MKLTLQLLFLLLFTSISFSQEIDITVNRLKSDKAIISSLSGEKIIQVDSVKSVEPGIFHFTMDANKYRRGFYRMTLDKNKWIDFIYDHEAITLETDESNIFDSMKVVTSESNRLYYQFVKLNRQYKTKSELLQFVAVRYPKDDEYYKITLTTLSSLQREYTNYINTTSQTKPTSFVARYIRSVQLPLMNAQLSNEKQLEFLKSHALDHVDFNDPGLMFSDAFANKAIEYLMYYRNPQLPKELLEKEFIIAVDTILNKARINPEVYQHLVEYLIDGFKKFGFDRPIDYIVENYVIKDDICLDTKLEGVIKKRIDQAKNFKPGMVVPDILLPDATGNIISLNNITAPNILIVFYSSGCPHCQEMLPKVNALYTSQSEKKTEVVAVSLDTDKKEWLDFITKNSLKWINISDLKGWDSPASIDYNMYATPSMFLIDKDKKVVDKPKNIEELKKHF